MHSVFLKWNISSVSVATLQPIGLYLGWSHKSKKEKTDIPAPTKDCKFSFCTRPCGFCSQSQKATTYTTMAKKIHEPSYCFYWGPVSDSLLPRESGMSRIPVDIWVRTPGFFLRPSLFLSLLRLILKTLFSLTIVTMLLDTVISHSSLSSLNSKHPQLPPNSTLLCFYIYHLLHRLLLFVPSCLSIPSFHSLCFQFFFVPNPRVNFNLISSDC